MSNQVDELKKELERLGRHITDLDNFIFQNNEYIRDAYKRVKDEPERLKTMMERLKGKDSQVALACVEMDELRERYNELHQNLMDAQQRGTDPADVRGYTVS